MVIWFVPHKKQVLHLEKLLAVLEIDADVEKHDDLVEK